LIRLLFLLKGELPDQPLILVTVPPRMLLTPKD
jgi:hypothetical protein